MNRPSARPRQLDRRRRLTPRDYLVSPHDFGVNRHAHFKLPPGGDATSLRLAEIMHERVLDWRSVPGRSSGASVARSFGFSKQTWSDVLAGRRWPGHTVLLALLDSAHQPGSR